MNLDPAIAYVALPTGPDRRAPNLSSGCARPLVDRARQLARGCCGRDVRLLGAFADGETWTAEEERAAPIGDLFRGRDVVLLANPSFLLGPQPRVGALVEAARREGRALCPSDDPHAPFALAFHRSRAPGHELTQALAVLGATSTGPARPRADLSAFEVVPGPGSRAQHSPAGAGMENAHRRRGAFSPVYLNTAFAEALYSPADTAPTGRSPQRVLEALLRQRDRSSVPWVFNELANALEHRIGAAVLESFPPEVHLSLTGRCNIECRFCSYAHETVHAGNVDVERMARLDFLRHLHVLRLSSGLGEPTINPHLPAILEHVASHYPQIGINFFTNGTALGRRGLIDALVARADWVNVSLNAATPETWAELCDKDLFGRLVAGLTELHQAKRARAALQPLVFGSMVLTAKNLHELPRMPALCRSLGIDRFTAIPFLSYGYVSPKRYGADESFHSCRDQYDQLYEETVREARAHSVSLEVPLPSGEKRAAFGVEVRGFYDFAGIEEAPAQVAALVEGLAGEPGERALCRSLWRIASIGSTNRTHVAPGPGHFLYPCLGPLGGIDFSTRTAFDFPDSREFLRLWNSEVFVKLRRAQRSPGLSPVCDACQGMDSRDPGNFERMGALLQEWQPGPALSLQQLALRPSEGRKAA